MRSRCSLDLARAAGRPCRDEDGEAARAEAGELVVVVELGREQPRRPAELLVALAASDGLADEQAERLLRADAPVDRLLEPVARQRGGDHLAPRQVEQVVEHVQRVREHPPPLRGEVADGGPGEDVADQPDRRVGRVERGPVRRAVEEQPGLVQADRSDSGEAADPRAGGERREHDRDVEALSEPEPRPSVGEDQGEDGHEADRRRDQEPLRQRNVAEGLHPVTLAQVSTPCK